MLPYTFNLKRNDFKYTVGIDIHMYTTFNLVHHCDQCSLEVDCSNNLTNQ